MDLGKPTHAVGGIVTDATLIDADVLSGNVIPSRVEAKVTRLIAQVECLRAEVKQLSDLKRAIVAVLVRWGIRGFIIRMVCITIALELIFVALPWGWHRWA